MADKKVICLWSGGKDSCFAAYQAKQAGFDVKYLVNFTQSNATHSLSHNIKSSLLVIQMRSLGIPFIQKEIGKASASQKHSGELLRGVQAPLLKVTQIERSEERQRDKVPMEVPLQDVEKDNCNGTSYEDCFTDVVKKAKKEDIDSIVFGDIYLEEHRDWIEKFCKKIAMHPVFPLWKISTEKIIRDFLKAGFRSILINVRKDALDKNWLGKEIDSSFIRHIKEQALDIDPCGESGEFHTFVTNGPLFKYGINILDTKITENDKYYSFDILDYELVAKED